MMNRTVLLDTGMKYLSEKLGLVEAERFITILLSEPFDYTEWRRDNLFTNMSVEQISTAAMEYRKMKNSDID